MAVSGILLLDKSEGWTSQDCVSKLRGIFHEKHIGHAGTLDPLATGLLVILIGRATRASTYAEAESKEYIATIRWGQETDTQDITGTTLKSSDQYPTPEQVQAALSQFIGEIQQIPPMYSAIKINGQKLYDIARRGKTVEREPRTITIHSINYVNRISECEDVLKIHCSKGTYIRTLCHDLGQALGCGACMAELRRTRIGSFCIENAKTIGQVTPEDLNHLIGIDTLFPECDNIMLTKNQEKRFRCGNEFTLPRPDGTYRFYDNQNLFLGIGEIQKQTAKCTKSFFEVDTL